MAVTLQLLLVFYVTSIQEFRNTYKNTLRICYDFVLSFFLLSARDDCASCCPETECEQEVALNKILVLGSFRTRTSTKTAAEFLAFRFPFSCSYNSCISFSFCLKVWEYEKLEAMFLKLHED